MKLGFNLGKILIYALALVIPGGGVAVAGYHVYKFVRNKTKEKQNGDIKNQLQGPSGRDEGQNSINDGGSGDQV